MIWSALAGIFRKPLLRGISHKISGHLETSLARLAKGQFGDDSLECVPDELRVRPSPPTQPSLLDLQRNIDELKDEIERLKQARQ
jgi:hypothetical protein